MNQENSGDPRFEHTEEVIRSTFLDMLRRLNYESVTVRELTEKAPINRKTFYLHYDSLDRLLETMRNESSQRAYDTIKDYSLPDQIPELVRALFVYWDNLPEDDALLWSCTSNRKIGYTFSDRVLQNGLSFTGKRAHNSRSQRRALEALTAALTSMYESYVAEGRQEPLDDLIAEATDIMQHGLS